MIPASTLRRMIADYMYSEGCDCCSDREKHEQDQERLAKVLKVPKYSDGSGYDFYRFRTKKRKAKRLLPKNLRG